MKKPTKKTSTKLVVDQYDKYCRSRDEHKRPKISEHQKKQQYHRFIDQQLQEGPTQIFGKNHSALHHRQCQQQKFHPTNMINDHYYDVMSESDDEPFTILMENQKNNNRQVKTKAKTNMFPLKKEQINVTHRIYKDSDYFPQQQLQKTNFQPPANKAKRPLSSMVKKNNHQQSLHQKSKEPVLKKTLSSSKFKEEHKKINHSLQKQKNRPQAAVIKNSQLIRNNIGLRKQPIAREPILNKLKKKNAVLAQKPLRIEEFQKPNLNNKRLHGEQIKINEKIPMKKQEEKPTPRAINSRVKEPIRIEREKSEHSQKSDRAVKSHPFVRRQFPQEERERQKVESRRRQNIRQDPRLERERQPYRMQFDGQRHDREQPRRQPRNQRHQRPRPQHRNREQQRRNNRNPRYQSSHSRQQHNPNPNRFFNFVSHTINQQLELMNNQFNMMSNMFESFSNFVNIDIDARGNHFHISSHFQSSEGYNTQSSDQFSSDEDYYYDANQSGEQEGLGEEELDRIEVIDYRVSKHGQNQCTICLIEMKNGDQAKKLFCEHIFHSECIDEWLKRKSACPVCRDKQ